MRGTGKCGYYRVPGESTAEEDKPKPKVKKNVRPKFTPTGGLKCFSNNVLLITFKTILRT